MDYLQFEKRCTRELDNMFYDQSNSRVKEMMTNEILRQRIALRKIWIAMGGFVPDHIKFTKPEESE